MKPSLECEVKNSKKSLKSKSKPFEVNLRHVNQNLFFYSLFSMVMSITSLNIEICPSLSSDPLKEIDHQKNNDNLVN